MPMRPAVEAQISLLIPSDCAIALLTSPLDNFSLFYRRSLRNLYHHLCRLLLMPSNLAFSRMKTAQDSALRSSFSFLIMSLAAIFKIL
jgi:hypothetical protein